MVEDNDDLEYIDILVEAGEYKELLEFLIDVLPNTKVSVDKINHKVVLDIWKNEDIEVIKGDLEEFKSNVSNINLNLMLNRPKGFIADFKIFDEKQYLDNLNVNNFIEDLKKVGIKLEKWQKEELFTLNFLRNANITRTRERF